jgi:hypothetical protein
VRYLSSVAQQAYDTAVQKAADLTQKLARQRADVLAQLASNPNDQGLKNSALALQTASTNAQRAYARIVSAGVPDAPLRLVEADSAQRLASPRSTSHHSLAVALAVIALVLLGGALGFGLGRHRNAART